VYVAPAVTLTVLFTHVPLFVQVLVTIVVPFRVAVVQSYVTVSGHVTLYQNESCVLPEGTVKVWVKLLSPRVGAVLPVCPHFVPPCQPLVAIAVVPAEVQPVAPDSNPPFVMPPPVEPVVSVTSS